MPEPDPPGDDSLWAGSVLGGAWGSTPAGWVTMVCRGCGADLETWDPRSVGPLLKDDVCLACAGQDLG